MPISAQYPSTRLTTTTKRTTPKLTSPTIRPTLKPTTKTTKTPVPTQPPKPKCPSDMWYADQTGFCYKVCQEYFLP